MENNNPMIRVNISLPVECHRKYAKLALKNDLSFSAYVRLSLRTVDRLIEKNSSEIGELLPFEAAIRPLRDDGQVS